jgi:hypothetical protein
MVSFSSSPLFAWSVRNALIQEINTVTNSCASPSIVAAIRMTVGLKLFVVTFWAVVQDVGNNLQERQWKGEFVVKSELQTIENGLPIGRQKWKKVEMWSHSTERMNIKHIQSFSWIVLQRITSPAKYSATYTIVDRCELSHQSAIVFSAQSAVATIILALLMDSMIATHGFYDHSDCITGATIGLKKIKPAVATIILSPASDSIICVTIGLNKIKPVVATIILSLLMDSMIAT